MNEFNIRDLGFWWRWYQEEKRQNETQDHQRIMEYIRTRSCFRHVNYVFGIYMTAMHHGGMIVSIAHGVKSKGKAESYKYDRNHTAHM